jgi:predicted membrane-bound spermidine synthase/tetratricopeptide (TPR) repeat protein
MTARSPLVCVLFFLSGISALIYEIVWTRMLTLVFGHTVYSVSVVLAAFMAGLGLGSYLWGASIDAQEKKTHTALGIRALEPLQVYGTFEVLIGLSGAVLSFLLSQFSEFYFWLHQVLPKSPLLLDAVKAALAFVLLTIPATFMGATLPIIGKYYVTDDTRLGSQVGFLYFINTLGAAAGSLLTGFALIDHFGVLQTVLGAAVLNLFVGIGAIRIYQDATGNSSWFRFPRWSFPSLDWTSPRRLWLATSFVCGFTALAYEVLWTRLLVFSIAGTVYSLSIMLGVFLAGIACGSLLLSIPALRRAEPRMLLTMLQAGIGLYVLFSLFGIESILSSPWNSYNLQAPLRSFGIYLKDSMALMLAPTLLFGMSMPLLIGIVSAGREDIGRATGSIYAANTLGAILGSLTAGFLLLPKMGSVSALLAVATTNLLLALALFRASDVATPAFRRGVVAVLSATLLFIHWTLPRNLLDSFFMRDSAGARSKDKLLFFEEGLTDTVAIFSDDYGILDPDAKRLITNGVSMSASNVIASRYMKLFAHVPILLSDRPEEVLVICFGTGQTAGAAGLHPRVKSVDAVDLSASVFRSGRTFAAENHGVLDNPKVHVILQDGRNHLLTTPKLYDVITGEPPPPRTAFTVNLYTQEYYEHMRRKLRPGGLAAQWIPLHNQSAREINMHFRTFLSVFPHAMAWMSVANEILLLGSDQPIILDFEKIRERMAEPVVKQALQDIRVDDAYSLLSAIWFLEPQLKRLAGDRPTITDNRPRIEFYLDFPNVIGVGDKEKLLFTRVRVDDLARKIRGLPEDGLENFHNHYRAMDAYQRGVLYGNRRQLLEAASLVANNDLFRYHLQADRDQIRRLVAVVEKEPGNVEAMLNLGHAFFQSGEYEKSLEFLRMVLEKDPKQSFADLYIGYDLMELGRRAEAKLSFISAMKKNPAHMNALMQEMGLIGLLDRLNQEPENPVLLNAVAQLYNVKNEYSRSLEFSAKALAKDPLDLQALQSTVFSYRGLGEPAELFDYAMRYNTLNPDELQVQYILGEMYAKTLQCDKAIPYLENILKKDDNFRNVQSLLAECDGAAGR